MLLFKFVLLSVIILARLARSSDEASNGSLSNASGFGYELTLTGLDAINFSIQQNNLRTQEQFQVLSSDVEMLRRTMDNVGGTIIKHMQQINRFGGDALPNIRNELELLSLNVSQVLLDTSQIYRVQQTMPTTKMLNDIILQLLADGHRKCAEPTHLPQTCAEVAPNRGSGRYRVQPQSGFKNAFEVYCNQEYEGGGWTVIQNRYDGSTYFYRGWDQYETGFGDFRGEFWLGLKKIHELTYAKPHELHVVMEDFDGSVAVAKYSRFLVGGPEEKYALNSLGNYSGNAGDSLAPSLGMKFTTLDADNDSHPPDNCAVMYKGAWWYAACHASNLNGLYLKGPQEAFATMMCWKSFRGYNYGLKRSRMMIRVSNNV
ncbi:techylectin-5A-like [Sabethes cyaneus]|uniref:techylectin-5A-like n=1 Tax=Sabethes cyaneus TaxID=53552 RepID=UPI00237D9FE1|nr:techylectin-5A-like [Sabethes cyaneus]